MENQFTAFLGEHILASGEGQKVIAQVKDTVLQGDIWKVMIFDDATGQQVEIDFRGTKEEVVRQFTQRFAYAVAEQPDSLTPRRGRPRLGVVPGEITLLPRHWEWLKNQPGGASVTIRKLVDEARRSSSQQDALRKAQEATYRFMTVMAGDRPQYEEALRAFYAGDQAQFQQRIADWPKDIREYSERLAMPVFSEKIQTSKS